MNFEIYYIFPDISYYSGYINSPLCPLVMFWNKLYN